MLTTDLFPKMRSILSDLPKPISMRSLYDHWNVDGHAPDPIVNDFLAKQKIRCPIYWDNDVRADILVNNYLCTCGKLFMYITSKNDKGEAVKSGFCPCDVCKYWSNGCRYGSVIL